MKKLIYQNFFLLLASYVFYGWWDYRFLSLIIFSTTIDFFLGQRIHFSKGQKQKKLFLWCSIVLNLGLLGFFKYFNFFIHSCQELINSMGFTIDTWTLNIILPVGISFYTFQTLSYSIDIYKNKIDPTKNFVTFAVFVSFFPQLVAGPIERASNLLPQFSSKRTFDYSRAINGFSLIIYGLFKKIVIADRLAIYVNSIFSDIENANTISLLLGMVFFSFQIYADFSGYSLIARGVAKLLGFELMINFNRPYLATSIPDFWRRWHISLSTWFRDYVYIPLGGNRVSNKRNYLNLMVVFLVSGLWHGANWTFVVWGALHGFYQIVYLQLAKIKKFGTTTIISKYTNGIIVYILVVFAWIFFRAESIAHAMSYIQKMLLLEFKINTNQITADEGILNLLISLIVIVLLLISYKLPKDLSFKKLNHSIVFNAITILIILIIGTNGEEAFIYFQF